MTIVKDLIDMKVKDSVLFEDTNECILKICEMVDHIIHVDYSVKPPVLKIGNAFANVGDVVGVLEDGSAFIAETPHPITE